MAHITNSMKIEIAGFKLKFYLNGFSLHEKLKRRYRYFIMEDEPGLKYGDDSISIYLKSESVTDEVVDEFSIGYQDGRYIIERNDLSVTGETGKDGSLSFHGNVHDSEFSFDMCVRGIMSILCSMHDVLMIHGSGILKDGKAYVFPGKEGRGKSTLIKTLPDNTAEILSDEVIFLRMRNNVLEACGSPFMGEVYSPRPRKYFPVKNILILCGWGENSIQQTDAGKRLHILLENVINYASGTLISNSYYNTAVNIAQTDKIRKLIFNKNNFWRWFNE